VQVDSSDDPWRGASIYTVISPLVGKAVQRNLTGSTRAAGEVSAGAMSDAQQTSFAPAMRRALSTSLAERTHRPHRLVVRLDPSSRTRAVAGRRGAEHERIGGLVRAAGNPTHRGPVIGTAWA